MKRKEISPKDFVTRPFDIWLNKWFLLSCGDEDNFNVMTVAWGSFGGVWNKPFAQIFVRPTRHTFGFCSDFPHFTLCSFPKDFRNDLNILGSKSGRDCDKLSLTGLTVEKSKKVSSPSFKEADLVLECRKIYWGDLNSSNFLDKSIDECYPQKDFHRVFFGEIVHVESAENLPV
ncbi:flavin reductase [candidate division WOR-3 bacterium]|nr:flavin reductase [candidate division WOR-3 bacterium]